MRIAFLALIASFLCTVGCAASAAPASTARPTRAPLTTNEAVHVALESLRADSPMGYLSGDPTLLRGQVMTHAQARLVLNGPTAAPPKYSPERTVWLIVTRGHWLLHIPGSQGDPAHGSPPVRPHNLLVRDMYAGVILDAATGVTLEQGGINPAQETAIRALPQLSRSQD